MYATLSRALHSSTHHNPQIQPYQGESMQDLLGDSNPMVVANALCALTEIKENASYEVVRFTPALLFKLLRALNECTEWGQVRAQFPFRHFLLTAAVSLAVAVFLELPEPCPLQLPCPSSLATSAPGASSAAAALGGHHI